MKFVQKCIDPLQRASEQDGAAGLVSFWTKDSIGIFLIAIVPVKDHAPLERNRIGVKEGLDDVQASFVGEHLNILRMVDTLTRKSTQLECVGV